MSKSNKNSILLSAVVYVLLGLFFIIWPQASRKIFCAVVGIAAGIFGLFEIIKYLLKKEISGLFDFSLIAGVLMLVGGLIFIFRSEVIIAVLGIAFGVAIVFDSILRLQIALNAAKLGSKSWIFMLVSAAIMLIFGIVLMFNPAGGFDTATIWYGIGLLLEGILQLVNLFIAPGIDE